MGLDKDGFSLLDNEYNSIKERLTEKYQNEKAEYVGKQVLNLTSTGKQRAQDIKNIESNYDNIYYKPRVVDGLIPFERRVFQDWGGSREAALKLVNQSEATPDKETDEQFKARLRNHFNEKSRVSKEKGRGR